MESFTAQLSRVRVSSRSPDRSITVAATMDDGFTVAFAGSIAHHTEESLAREITVALHRAAAGLRRARQQLGQRRWGSPRREDQRGERAPRSSPLDFSVASPRHYAKVGVHGGDLTVRVKPGVLRRIDVGRDQLLAEINAAIVRAREELERAANRRRDAAKTS